MKKVGSKENNRRVCMKLPDSVVTFGRNQIKRIMPMSEVRFVRRNYAYFLLFYVESKA